MGTEFNKEQFDAIYPDGIENHYWTYARNKILYHVLNKHYSQKTILEVGCGKGIVVNYLFNKGLNISGVELAEIPIEEKLQSIVKSGINVFDLSPSECEKIDVIMLLDVIEHIEFPNDFLKQLKNKFPNLKSFIVSVPACNELFSNYDVFNGHFRRYDQNMLKNEFEGIRNKTIDMSYFFHALYLPAKILLNTNGKRAEEIIAPKGFLKKMVHRLLANIFYAEFLVLPGKLKGTSLLLKIDLN
jgi:hypothetical protein